MSAEPTPPILPSTSTAGSASAPSAVGAPPRTKREQQGDRSRVEILDAAEQLMSTKGYAATSISDLARESGLPASSIYWHFSSKSGVLAAVMERGATRFFRDSAGIAELHEGGDVRARLYAMIRGSRRLVSNHPAFLRLFMLLLLGSEGEHAQEEVVTKVRTEGRRALVAAVTESLAPWGDPMARVVADKIGDVAMVLFDGYFIASEADPSRSGEGLGAQVADALHAVALTARAELES